MNGRVHGRGVLCALIEACYHPGSLGRSFGLDIDTPFEMGEVGKEASVFGGKAL